MLHFRQTGLCLFCALVGCRSCLQHGPAASGRGAPGALLRRGCSSLLSFHVSVAGLSAARSLKSETPVLEAAAYNAVRLGEASGRDTIGDLAQWLEARRAVKLVLSLQGFRWKATGNSTENGIAIERSGSPVPASCWIRLVFLLDQPSSALLHCVVLLLLSLQRSQKLGVSWAGRLAVLFSCSPGSGRLRRRPCRGRRPGAWPRSPRRNEAGAYGRDFKRVGLVEILEELGTKKDRHEILLLFAE